MSSEVPRAFLARVADASGSAAPPRPGPTLTDDYSDQALRGDLARSAYGVSGAGIRIGILSDSFNRLGGQAADVAAGTLPAGVTVVKEGPVGSADEGRAMADLIHRIAPAAQLYFYTAMDSEADFARGITTLQNQYHAQVIVDDVTYFDEPFYQDGGAVQAAVEKVVGEGTSYFTAAGNEGADFYEHPFQSRSASLPGSRSTTRLQNFGSAGHPSDLQSLTVQAGSTVTLDLQWDSPYASIGGHGTPNSLGLYVFNANNQLAASSAQDVTGGNPDQILTFTNASRTAATYKVAIADTAGVAPGLFKYIVYGNATINDANAGHGSGDVIGHAMVAGANTVGATPYYETPRFGINPATPEPFSSIGPGELLFDRNGDRLGAPQFLGKADFSAPDGSTTSVFNPFYGTSAAAPSAAAVAALMLQADPLLTPADVTAILKAMAAPMAGNQAVTGSGLVQADAAVRQAVLAASRPGGSATHSGTGGPVTVAHSDAVATSYGAHTGVYW